MLTRSGDCERPIVLVSLDWTRPGDPRTGLGSASIASACRAAEVPVEVVEDAVNRPGFDPDHFVERVVSSAERAGAHTLVGVGAYVWNEAVVQRLLRVLSARGVPVVLGGPQVSYTRAGELEALYPGASAFVRGHAEAALPALARTDVPEGQHGVHHAGRADLGRVSTLDLAKLPSPHVDGSLAVGPFVRWETQRGCMFACSFCQHREAGGRAQRGDFALERIFRETKLFSESSVKRISVLDPIFHSDRQRAVAILGEVRRVGLRAQLSLQCRFELIDDAFLDAIAGLDVVLEFGIQTIHADEGKAVGRPNDVAKAERVIAKLHARRIPFEVSLIYGLPQQTLDSFRRSADWCLAHRVPRVRAWPLMLLRGTLLYDQRDRWGYVEGGTDGIPIVVSSSTFTERDHSEMARIAASLDAGIASQEVACAAFS